MPSIRQRVYSYLVLVAVPILLALYMNNIIKNKDYSGGDFRNIPVGTKLSLRCDIPTHKTYYMMPDIVWFYGVDKLQTLFNIQYDYWSIQTYEAKIKISDNPLRPFVPKSEYLIIGGPTVTDIDKNGKITYIIPLEQPTELSEIIISSYIEHYTGFLGKISYIFQKIYPKKLTMKEFNKVMGCVDKVIYPKGENKNVR